MNSLSITGVNEVVDNSAKLSLGKVALDTIVKPENVKKEDQDLIEKNKIEETSKAADVEEPDKEALKSAIDVIASFMNHKSKHVNFLIDEGTDKLVIRVVDAKNNELIKQFPSEEILDMANKVKGLRQEIGENTGILIDSKV